MIPRVIDRGQLNFTSLDDTQEMQAAKEAPMGFGHNELGLVSRCNIQTRGVMLGLFYDDYAFTC